jgi:hypothetical protein
VWCFALEWATEIRRHTVHDIAALNEQTPLEHNTGHTPNIAALCTYSFYDYCWFWDSEQGFLDQQRVLGRWLGISHDIGGPLTYFTLPKSCRPIARSIVTPVTPEALLEPANKALAEELDKVIDEKIGKFRTNKEVAEELGMLFGPSGDLCDGDLDPFDEIEAAEEPALMPEADEWTPETFDKYLAAEVLLPHGGELVRAKVTGRKRVVDGTPVGVAHLKPILDTCEYEVSFPNKSTNCYAANMIAESLYSQVDADGREFILMKEIVDHRLDGSVVPVDDAYYVDPNGRRTRRMTTKGWKLLVEWKDSTMNWLPLKDLKESYPVQVAEYAVANKIAEQPAFAWWVPYILRKQDLIIQKVKSWYWKRTHKYGVELPKSVKQVLAIDRNMGTSFWKDVIEKEMKNILPAFEFRDNDVMPLGFKKIDCHMVFDVELDLVCKAWFVAGGHQTDPPKESVYSSVVSRDSVCLAFLIAALNDLEVLSADVQNAYLNAPTKEKIYMIAGPEFGQGRRVGW